MPHYGNQLEDLGIIPTTVPLHYLGQALDYTPVLFCSPQRSADRGWCVSAMSFMCLKTGEGGLTVGGDS